MYKKLIDYDTKQEAKIIQRLSDGAFIPFDPANTDYQNFKIDLVNGAELHDANNNVMTSDQVTTFISTLP